MCLLCVYAFIFTIKKHFVRHTLRVSLIFVTYCVYKPSQTPCPINSIILPIDSMHNTRIPVRDVGLLLLSHICHTSQFTPISHNTFSILV